MQVVNRTRELVAAQIECLKARPTDDADVAAALAKLNAELATFAESVTTAPADDEPSRREFLDLREQLAAVSAERDNLGEQVNAQAQELHENSRTIQSLRADLAKAKAKKPAVAKAKGKR